MSRMPRGFRVMKIKGTVANSHPDFAVLDRLCFPTDTPAVADGEHHFWLAYRKTAEGEVAVAFAGLRVDRDRGIVDFTRCGVHASSRGFGLQRALIDARLSWAKKNGIKLVKTYVSGPENPCGGENVHSARNLRAAGFRGRRSKCGQWIFFRKAL